MQNLLMKNGTKTWKLPSQFNFCPAKVQFLCTGLFSHQNFKTMKVIVQSTPGNSMYWHLVNSNGVIQRCKVRYQSKGMYNIIAGPDKNTGKFPFIHMNGPSNEVLEKRMNEKIPGTLLEEYKTQKTLGGGSFQDWTNPDSLSVFQVDVIHYKEDGVVFFMVSNEKKVLEKGFESTADAEMWAKDRGYIISE